MNDVQRKRPAVTNYPTPDPYRDLVALLPDMQAVGALKEHSAEILARTRKMIAEHPGDPFVWMAKAKQSLILFANEICGNNAVLLEVHILLDRHRRDPDIVVGVFDGRILRLTTVAEWAKASICWSNGDRVAWIQNPDWQLRPLPPHPTPDA